MALAIITGLIKIIIMANLQMERGMAKAFWNIVMEECIMVFSKTIKRVGKDSNIMKITYSMRESTKTILDTAGEF